MVQIVELTGTTDALGALTLNGAATDKVVGKFIETIVYDWSDGDTGADIVVTMENGAATQAIMTKANLGVADATFYPRTLGNKVADGSAFTDPATRIFCVGTPKIVVSSGGNAKTLRFLLYFSDE